MTLSDDARNIFDALPPEGKVGGISLQRELNISKLTYQAARDELKAAGLVEVGGGRGGSLGRMEGAQLPEEEKPVTQAQRLEYARDAKRAKSREQKQYDELRDLAYQWAAENFDGYQVKKPSDVYLHAGQLLVAIWDGPKAKVYAIPQLEVDKMKAHYVR